MLHVEGEALLAAIGPHEVRRQATHALVVAACEVPDAGAFDLDDACAEIGELSRGERRGDRVLERDNGDAGKRSHLFVSFNRSARSRPSQATLRGPWPIAARSRHQPTARRTPRTDGCRTTDARRETHSAARRRPATP